MTNTYLTGDPLGSTAVKNLYDNASNFDEVMNSPSPSFTDRFGMRRETWAGMEKGFDDFLLASGYQFIGDYDADGPLTITQQNQIFSKDGDYWRASAALALPYTTVNNWATDQPKFVAIGDAALRSDLANANPLLGSALVYGIGRVVGTIALLRALPTTGSHHAFVVGYYAAGDGGGGSYRYDPTDATSADNGGSIIVATDGGRWKLTQTAGWSVLQFGAKGDGVSNDTIAIQSAIDALPARGGEVLFPGGTFAVSATLRLGNGNGGTTFSTKNGIKIKGQGAGFGVSGALVPTILSWVGASGSAIMSLNGRISDCEISDFFFSCNGTSGGLFAQAFSGCRFSDLKIVNPATNNNGMTLLGGTAPTGNYNVFNKFSNISIGLLSPTSTGLYIDGNYPAVNDTWLTTFELIRIETVAGATGARCAWFKFIDSCTFNRCHFDSKPEPSSLGLILDASGNPGFLNDYPIGLAFYDCSISKIDVIEDGLSKIGPTYFYGHGVNDIEVIPNHPRLFGITANGDIFGPLAGFKHRVAGDVLVQNNASITPVYTYAVGAYFLGGVDSFKAKNGGLRVRQTGAYVNDSGVTSNFNVTVTFGGVTLFSAAFAAVPTGASARTFDLDFTFFLSNNIVNAQHGRATAVLGAVGSTAGGCTAPYQTLMGSNSIATDTSTTKDLIVFVQHQIASASIAYTAKNTTLELL